MKKILYISEISLPNESAQSIQTLKMCSGFSKSLKTELILFNAKKNFKIFKKNYLLKNNFKIKSAFKKNRKLNFVNRIIFFLKVLTIIKKTNYSYIFTRSILISTLLAMLGYKNILEFHIPNSGLTKYIFFIYKIFFRNLNQKFVLINKNINQVFNFPKEKFIVLDSPVDIKDFNYNKQKFKKSCVYTGSFFDGKGFDKIIKISRILKEIDFYVYGDLKYLRDRSIINKYSNLKIYSYKKYSKIPYIISQHKVCLLPYEKKVYVKSKSVTAERFMSPLKLMEYMASKKVIIASKMQIYEHILKNQKNSFLVKSDNLKKWTTTIRYVFKNYNKLKYMRLNAYATAKKFDVNQRAIKIINFFDTN